MREADIFSFFLFLCLSFLYVSSLHYTKVLLINYHFSAQGFEISAQGLGEQNRSKLLATESVMIGLLHYHQIMSYYVPWQARHNVRTLVWARSCQTAEGCEWEQTIVVMVQIASAMTNQFISFLLAVPVLWSSLKSAFTVLTLSSYALVIQEKFNSILSRSTVAVGPGNLFSQSTNSVFSLC